MLWTHIDKLTPWEQNPRINAGAIPKVAASIKRFGFVAPVVVWTSKGRIVAGHTRVEALRSILAEDPTFKPGDAPGPGLVPVREHEFKDEAEAAAYGVADNRLSYEAEWDYAQLGHVLESVNSVDPGLFLATGFSDKELAAMTAAIEFKAPTIVPLEPLKGAVRPDDAGGGAGTQAPAYTPPQDALLKPEYVSLQFTKAEFKLLSDVVSRHEGETCNDPLSVACGLINMIKEGAL